MLLLQAAIVSSNALEESVLKLNTNVQQRPHALLDQLFVQIYHVLNHYLNVLRMSVMTENITAMMGNVLILSKNVQQDQFALTNTQSYVPTINASKI